MSSKMEEEKVIGRHRIVVEIYGDSHGECVRALRGYVSDMSAESNRPGSDVRTHRRVSNGVACSFQAGWLSESERTATETRSFGAINTAMRMVPRLSS